MTPYALVTQGALDGVPVFDYAPSTLLGIGVLMLLMGRLVPWTVVKDKNAQNAKLESAVAKLLEAGAVKDQALLTEQNAHSETRRMLAEEQKTGEIVRKVFGGVIPT